VVPTLNEATNVALLVAKLAGALPETSWEAIFVDDDSPDGTADIVATIGCADPRVRCLRRINRRGLAGACIEGILAARGRNVAIMDGDLQHDAGLLKPMLRILQGDMADVVAGSRYVSGAGAAAFPLKRLIASRLAGSLAKSALGIDITDPTSGFFMMRTAVARSIAPRLSPSGFKILMDILASRQGDLRVLELPYTFHPRRHGTSKLGGRATLGTLIDLGARFVAAQAVATVVTMTASFFLYRALSGHARAVSGSSVVRGLVVFHLVGAAGALGNVVVAYATYRAEPVWWLAGGLGFLVGISWNCAISTILAPSAKNLPLFADLVARASVRLLRMLPSPGHLRRRR
jgi:dolichol-phosphate mannosyltransferase